jgi:Monooxygenase subunit B protein
LGLAWLMYWVAQPILRRSLLVASGAEESLITRRDRRVSIVLGVLTGMAIGIGVLTTKASYPHTIPHQVIKVEIPTGPQPANFVKIKREAVRYDPDARTLTLEAEVTNTDEKPAILRACLRRYCTSQATDHDVNHGHPDHGFTGLGQVLIIFREAAVAAEPGEGPLHAPPFGKEQEALDPLRSFDNLQADFPPGA